MDASILFMGAATMIFIGIIFSISGASSTHTSPWIATGLGLMWIGLAQI